MAICECLLFDIETDIPLMAILTALYTSEFCILAGSHGQSNDSDLIPNHQQLGILPQFYH